jgi:hypothetical protein
MLYRQQRLMLGALRIARLDTALHHIAPAVNCITRV